MNEKPKKTVNLEQNQEILENARVDRISNGVRNILSDTDKGRALIRAWDEKQKKHQKNAHISQDLEKIKKLGLS